MGMVSGLGEWTWEGQMRILNRNIKNGERQSDVECRMEKGAEKA